VKNLASLTGFYDDLIIDNAEMAWFLGNLVFWSFTTQSLREWCYCSRSCMVQNSVATCLHNDV